MLFGARTMSPFLLDAENDSPKSLGPQESSFPLNLWTVQVPRNIKGYSLNFSPGLFPPYLPCLLSFEVNAINFGCQELDFWVGRSLFGHTCGQVWLLRKSEHTGFRNGSLMKEGRGNPIS